MKLCVFDFDSTLMDGETIDFFAKKIGVEDEVSKITKLAMQGELDFFESLTTRVKLLEGLDEKEVNDVCKNLPYMYGAKETIIKLKSKGYKVVVLSGGFRNATSYAKDILGYDIDFSNVLHVKHGKLTGLVGGEMMFNFSKGDMIQRLQQFLGVSRANTVVVGDGANDLSMFAHANLRVAFCAKEVLKQQANAIIDVKDMRKLLELI
ncbi:MAG: phosphoserine phosphatase SerB [Sulfurospirillum sp.]|nr:phosphoserine phosphatase SerB [Sulfurospirillum sp.]MBL0702473.1 phosphoserine phosphatase SerB [Sulfurospirillum sp.]